MQYGKLSEVRSLGPGDGGSWQTVDATSLVTDYKKSDGGKLEYSSM